MNSENPNGCADCGTMAGEPCTSHKILARLKAFIERLENETHKIRHPKTQQEAADERPSNGNS